MKIAIITLTTTARRTGVGEYVINLIEELQRIDKINEYFIFTGIDNRYMFELNSSNFKEVSLPLTHSPGYIMRPVFHFWQIFILPFWCRINGIDLIHLPNTLYVSGFFPTVSSIHDVVELKVKKYFAFRTFIRRIMINSSMRNARKIITVSDNTALDLKELGAKNVVSIHLGFRNPYKHFDIKNQGEILRRYKLFDISYVLFIGTMLIHKNIPILINAFKIAKEKEPLLKLVLIGDPDNDFGNIKKTISVLNIEDNVLILNFVSQEEKLVVLKNCKIFCFISSYEGFGIPILEAQAACVPVIANNASSLPEVGGEGVFLVNPGDLENETAKAIIEISNNTRLRETLIEKGKENILRFSWTTLAQRTLEVYSQFEKLKR